jgi:hypothetical protein
LVGSTMHASAKCSGWYKQSGKVVKNWTTFLKTEEKRFIMTAYGIDLSPCRRPKSVKDVGRYGTLCTKRFCQRIWQEARFKKGPL